jgi:hypothetical protein
MRNFDFRDFLNSRDVAIFAYTGIFNRCLMKSLNRMKLSSQPRHPSTPLPGIIWHCWDLRSVGCLRYQNVSCLNVGVLEFGQADWPLNFYCTVRGVDHNSGGHLSRGSISECRYSRNLSIRPPGKFKKSHLFHRKNKSSFFHMFLVCL